VSGLPNPLDPSRRIAAILFDLDGTLYHRSPLRALMLVELLALPFAAPHLAFRRLRALRTYRHTLEDLREGLEGGGIAEAQLAAAARASGLPLSDARRLVEGWMLERPLKYLRLCRVRGVTGMLRLLDRRGVRAGILSDYAANAKLQALGIAGRFSPVLVSTQPDIDALKPNPRGFLRACELWRLPPGEVLMVGDRAAVDAAGAAAAGMPCVIIGSRATHREENPGYRVFPSLQSLLGFFEERS
jgi:putative hydrolase of the HAD superfamily